MWRLTTTLHGKNAPQRPPRPPAQMRAGWRLDLPTRRQSSNYRNPTKKINAPSIVLKIRLLNIVFNKLIKFLILFKFLLDIKNSVFIFYMVVYL